MAERARALGQLVSLRNQLTTSPFEVITVPYSPAPVCAETSAPSSTGVGQTLCGANRSVYLGFACLLPAADNPVCSQCNDPTIPGQFSPISLFGNGIDDASYDQAPLPCLPSHRAVAS